MRRWGALLALVAVGGLVYAVLYTPLLGVRSVDVRGTDGLTKDEVRAAAGIEIGKPMLRLDLDQVKARVAALPRVSTVEVRRSWPSTVEVTVAERTPVGVMPRPDGVHLVDRTGKDYLVVAEAPPGLPTIDLPRVASDDPVSRAVVEVLGALPAQLSAKVTSVTARSPGSVQLTLADGRVVRWGSSADSDRKAAVLGALMTQPGKIYDVASPDLPTISP